LQHNFQTLLYLSKKAFAAQPDQVQQPFSLQLFQNGAIWMQAKMNDLNPANKVWIDKKISFNGYGFLKYSICLSAFATSFFFFLNKNVSLIPLSVLVFYFFEVHFLFLFPLLLDKIPHPIWKSIRLTYKLGVFRAMFIVLQIAMFMLWGILNVKNPFKNWHIGCLCILIWYQDEIRNRL
jgi:hypothetical protein